MKKKCMYIKIHRISPLLLKNFKKVLRSRATFKQKSRVQKWPSKVDKYSSVKWLSKTCQKSMEIFLKKSRTKKKNITKIINIIFIYIFIHNNFHKTSARIYHYSYIFLSHRNLNFSKTILIKKKKKNSRHRFNEFTISIHALFLKLLGQ